MGHDMLLDAGVVEASEELVLDHLVGVVGGSRWEGEVAHCGLSLKSGYEKFHWFATVLRHVQEGNLVQEDVVLTHPQVLHEAKKLCL